MPRKTGTEVATTQPKRSLIAKMAGERGVEAAEFYKTVTETMFKGANQSQLMTLLLVADRYHLDVTTREIFAFPAQGGGIVPVVSIDGWISLANQHPQFDGEEIIWAEKWIEMPGGKRCPEWCEIRVYRKDRARPTVVREYLDEVYRATPTWKSHTKRMLRHKTMIQGYRVAFGFSGIKDEDEAQRIVTEGPDHDGPTRPSSVAAAAREALGAAPPTSEAPDAPEELPEDENERLPNRLSDEAYDEVTGEVFEDDSEPEYEAEVVDEDPPEPEVIELATKQQLSAIKAARKNGGWSDEAYGLLLAEWNVGDPAELTRKEALEVVRTLMSGPEGQEEMPV